MSAKNVATTNATEMMPAHLRTDENLGNENVTAADIAIPRLGLVQDLSPQRKKTEPEYIPGAEEGMLFNTVTQELYGTSVDFIPVMFRKEWIIWKIRKAGGGLIGAFPTESEARREVSRMMDPSVMEIVDTAQQFGLLVMPDGSLVECVILMQKSKMKANRQLNSMIRLVGGPRWARIYTVSSIPDKNKNNEAYFNLKVTAKGWVTEDQAKAARDLYDAVKAGVKDIDRSVDEESNGSDHSGNTYGSDDID